MEVLDDQRETENAVKNSSCCGFIQKIFRASSYTGLILNSVEDPLGQVMSQGFYKRKHIRKYNNYW